MSKIILKFSGSAGLIAFGKTPTVVLSLDEEGKNYSIEYDEEAAIIAEITGMNAPESLPKRILNAFTESAIKKIFAKDEIPNESEYVVLDGYNYTITIIVDSETKEYEADDASIETYPLLRYLASWYRKL